MERGEIFEGRYRIEGLLGSGGHAHVYLAEHVQIGSRVAIKVLHSAGMTDRFTREGQILARLKSAHTVRILDFGETTNGRWYLISEYVEGQTLEQLRLRGAMKPDEVLELLMQLLDSLAEAHEMGIIHRDIKPQNVMRLPDGQIKVLDFGIAALPANEDGERLTMTGALLGTPRYMAPECLLGASHGRPSSDIYSAAMVVYALLTGHPAVDANAFDQVLAKHLEGDIRLPDDPAIPITLRRWFDLAARRSPDERFTDGGAALAFLHSGASQPTAPVPAAPTPSPAHWSPVPAEDPHLTLDERALRPLVTTPVPNAPPPSTPGNANRMAVLLLALLLLAVAAAGVRVVTSESTAPAVDSRPDDPTHIQAAYGAGIVAFDERDWLTALEQFQVVRLEPSTDSARAMEHQQYWERTVSAVLQDAIDLRERARTAKQFEAAAAGPAKLLELEPQHEAAQAVLLSIAQEPKERRKKRRPRKIQITGVQ